MLCFSIKKTNSANIFSYYRVWIPQGTNYKRPQVFVTVIVQVIRSFLEDLRYDVDENAFSKKAYFADEKQFWSFFFRIIESGTPQVKFYWAPQDILEIFFASYRIIPITPTGLLKTQSFEEVYLYIEKLILVNLFSYY